MKPEIDAAEHDLRPFQGAFLEEAAEHLAEMESLLVRLDIDAPSREALDAIFRAAHSIKGGSSMFGFTDMTILAHEFETLLDRVRTRELVLRPPIVDVLLQASDLLREQLAHYGGEAAAPRVAVADMCAQLRACQANGGGRSSAGASGRAPSPATPAANGRQRLSITVPADAGDLPKELLAQLRVLGDLTETTPVTGPSDRRRKVPGARTFELATDSAPHVVLTLFEFVMDASRVQVSALPAHECRVGSGGCRTAPRPAGATDSSIRVGVDKVDQLIDRVGKLAMTQARLAQAAGRLDPVVHEELLSGIADLAGHARNLQESAMAMRMLPMAFVFNRFPRLVRDLAAKLGKEVRLVTHGDATELDRAQVERIADPLMHLVRNAIDHGIETPQARLAADKPACGCVMLRVAHQGGNILIEVADDGGGLDRPRILAAARARGLPVSDAPSDAEVWSLIFEPGLSTAQSVTDVSGRGVGMDVVRRNINELGGRVEIESVRGAGTRITVRLPSTCTGFRVPRPPVTAGWH